MNSFSEFSCSYFNFYLDLRNGLKSDSTPRWTGIDNILQVIDNTTNEIKNLNGNFEATFNNFTTIEQNTTLIFTELSNIYQNNYKVTFDNPNPAISKKNGEDFVVPSYIKVIIKK